MNLIILVTALSFNSLWFFYFVITVAIIFLMEPTLKIDEKLVITSKKIVGGESKKRNVEDPNA